MNPDGDDARSAKRDSKAAPPVAPAQPNADEIDAAAVIQGANPFVGLSIAQTARAAGRWAGALTRHPTVLVGEVLKWTAEELRVVAGVSDKAPEPKDKRFQDPAWQRPLWKRISQSYVVSRAAVLGSIDEIGLDDKSADRARFALSQITEAAAPTNNLLLNPTALQRARETRGRSLVAGGRHMLYDIRHNGGLPSQVDSRPFRVGETIALTPGAVVHRTPLYELIQYTPRTTVYQRPTVIIPPQVNRYYFLDIAPGRSFVEHSVASGFQTFMMSWRNASREERHFGLDDYVAACLDAARTAAEITKADRVNLSGFCAGGMTESALLSYLADQNDDLISSAMLAVTMMDGEVSSTLNMFASERSVRASLKKSRKSGVLDGKSLGRVFTWVRPNDLVWNYWVSNYLLGQTPPAFDVLAWNNDQTNLPAALHADLLKVWMENGLIKPGTTEVLGHRVDLTRVKTDIYVVGALTDHLVPWQSAYAATQAFGGDVRFILSNSGHIQALINPPGNPKASYFQVTATPPDPAQWLAGARKEAGSWWEDWARWVGERSGAKVRRPRALGSRKHKIVEPAPGRYVNE